MSLLAQRLYVLVRTECVLRLRRASTWALFLFLCASAYLIMPDREGGNTAFQIGQQRVLLTSEATSLATALMGSLSLSLFGFYLVSNTITRDARTGVGRLVASTPVASANYLLGKFLGNTVYLGIVTAGFMVACMGMHLLRGDGPLEPLTFLFTFAIFFAPVISMAAAFALLFESVRFLSGRGGDLLYFFIWATLLSVPAVMMMGDGGAEWPKYLDTTGAGLALTEIRKTAGTESFSIGVSRFNPALPPVVFPGIPWTGEIIAGRVIASLITLPLLGLALLGFRRFDPSYGRATAKKKGRAFLSRAGDLLGGRWLVPKGRWLTGPPTLLRAAGLDVQLSLVLSPYAAAAVLALAIASLVTPSEGFQAGYLPVLFFVLVPLLAGVPTRDRVSNTTGLVFGAPLLRQHFVAWKFLSVLLLVLLVAMVPLLRTIISDPGRLPALLVGLIFLASAATALGVLTGTPKTFVVLFLFFLYIVVNSKTEPGLDFAGWHGLATPGVLGAYAAVGLGALGVAWMWEKRRMQD